MVAARVSIQRGEIENVERDKENVGCFGSRRLR